jgi:hypothetical protein
VLNKIPGPRSKSLFWGQFWNIREREPHDHLGKWVRNSIRARTYDPLNHMKLALVLPRSTHARRFRGLVRDESTMMFVWIVFTVPNSLTPIEQVHEYGTICCYRVMPFGFRVLLSGSYGRRRWASKRGKCSREGADAMRCPLNSKHCCTRNS